MDVSRIPKNLTSPPGFQQPRCNFECHRSTERMAKKANMTDRLAALDLLDCGVCHAGNGILSAEDAFEIGVFDRGDPSDLAQIADAKAAMLGP